MNTAVALLGATLLASPAQAVEPTPSQLEGVTVVEHLGERVDPSIVLVDHDGNEQTLDRLLDSGRPTLLTFNYYTCQTLCSLQLNALLSGLKQLDWTAGQDFDVLTVSFDPRDTTQVAEGKRANYLAEYGREDSDWTFTTGDPAQVEALADSVGFTFRYDAETDQWAHPAALVFLAPDGTVARYLYGLQYETRDLEFALMEAASGRLGSPVDKLIFSCFQYDESVGDYAPEAFRVMRIGGAATVVGLGGLTFFLYRREKTWLNRTSS